MNKQSSARDVSSTPVGGKTPPITMSKLYVGNLPNEASESTLRQLFHEQGLSCNAILVKRGGYAFVDCPDQSSADRAIDKLNGYNFKGSLLTVEPSVAPGKRKKVLATATAATTQGFVVGRHHHHHHHVQTVRNNGWVRAGGR